MSFCSRIAQTTHSPLAGTGPRGDVYVFIPVPKRFWGENEMNLAWATEEELRAIQLARRGGVVTRLYNPPPTVEDRKIQVHMGDRTPAELEPLLQLLGRRFGVDKRPDPQLFVCTHGTRDRCCAKWGFAVYRAALKRYEAGTSPFRPLESSHLGGDRFAATGVFFPSGSMYAHLDTVDLDELFAAEGAGRLQPDFYRGRVFEPEAAQVARYGLAREGIADDASAPVRFLEPWPAEEAKVQIADGRRFIVRLQSVETRFYGSCDALAQGKASRARRLAYGGHVSLEP